MKNVLILLILTIFLVTPSLGLEPIKVAIINTSGVAVNVQVKLNDYTSGSPSLKYTGPITSLIPNGSGVIVVDIANNIGTDWSDITPSQVNSYYILDVYVNTALYAQYRLDNLIIGQSQVSIIDNDGNLSPPTSSSSLGSDPNRWEDAYVGSNTLHIGPNGGMVGGTEMTLSYDLPTNSGKVKVDGTVALSVNTTGVTIPNALTMSNLGGSGNRNIGVDNDGNIVVNTPTSITAGNGLTLDVSNVLDVGGSSTIIANANDVEVNSSSTANQVLLSSGTVGTAATYGAIPLGSSNSISGTLPVTNGGTGAVTLTSGNFLQGNGTGAVTATKSIPTGAVVGTTDTQTLTNKTINTASNTIVIDASDVTTGTFADARISSSSVTQHEGDITIGNLIGAPTGAVVGTTDTQTLTNKTINTASNTIVIDASDVTTGTFADARISSSSVTQHEGDITIGNLIGAPTGAVVGTTDTQTLTNKTINTASNTIVIDASDVTTGTFADARISSSSVTQHEGDITIGNLIGAPTGAVVGTTDVQTLTNKTIDSDNNTITNIANADIKAGAAIDASKLADGSVSNTELQFINSVTSNVQDQIDSKQPNLPTQTGNSGKYLKTDGTNVSWDNVPIGFTAGNGLTIDGSNNLDVGGSSTIIANANDVEVNSSSTANQVLLSSGTVGTAATYGAIPLGSSNSISGTLPVTNGGTGAVTLTTGNFLQGNGTGAVTATKSIPTGAVVGTTDTQTLTNKTINTASNTIVIDASDVTTGTFADARISSSSVTQHEGDITIGNLIGAPTGAVVGTTDTQTLTNKTINTANNTIVIDASDVTSGTFADARISSSSVTQHEGDITIGNLTGAPTGAVVGTTDAQTLTNKTIDADNNTISNIANANIKASAAIDATKLADGTVSNAELQFINSVTSNVQDQIDSKQPNLPTQTGNGGKYLKTDGTSVSWDNVPIGFTAGNGLTIDGSNNLDVGGSSTIIVNANDIEVNSSATANQVLLSSGTLGTAATYGAIPLGNSNSVSGTLPVANGGTGASTLAIGNFLQGNGTGAVTATKSIPTGAVVGTTDAQTLTNKTIDSDNNTISNIVDSDIKATAGIDATKIADGTVTNAELQFINSVTSNVQDQIDGKAASSHTHSTADITGTLSVSHGGTGTTTLATGNFLQGNGTGAVTATKVIPSGAVVGTTDAQTLTNKTLTAPVISTISNTGTLTLPTSTTTLVGINTTDVLTNKSIDADNNTITNIDNADIKASAAIDATKLANGSVSNTEFQFLDGLTSAVIGTNDVQTLTNKSLVDATTFFQDNIDNTKKVQLELSGLSTGTTRILTVPNVNTTLVGTDATQTLTNKTLTAPVISTISNSGTITLPTGTNTLVGRTTTDVLTNKTLTAPVISTISNSGTITLPTGTNTLVGRNTTDVLTNKTLTAPVISTISNAGTITLPTATTTLVGRNTADVLTNKSIDSDNNTITNIVDANIKTGAAIDATKLANGLVSNTEFQYLDGLTSAVIGTNDVQTLTNKSLVDATTFIQDNLDNTKKVQLELSGLSTGTTRILTVPNVNTTLVGTDATQTLTNKTLTAPVISTITNTGTITLPTATTTLVGRNTTDVLTNKSIDADNNTITNIENADIKAGAAIDASKLANGTISNAELQFINSVTSNVQDQIDGKQPNLPDTTGKSGQYLKTEDGNLKWETVSGGGGAFTSAGGKTTSNTLTDDFIFGADSINYGTGTENKFFFDNNKGAFRAGTIQNSNWDDGSNIGTNSFAVGLNTRANGTYSAAFGSNANASGSGSVAMGISTIASNQYAFATGGFTEASGFAAVATGFYAVSSGDISAAFGEHTTAESYGEFVVGSYDTDYTPIDATNFNAADRAFVVGNGTSSARSDALIVYKNGNMDVNGNLSVGGTSILNGTTSVTGSNTLTVGTGATTLGGTLGVTGATTTAAITASGDVTISNLAGGGTRNIQVDNTGKIIVGGIIKVTVNQDIANIPPNSFTTVTFTVTGATTAGAATVSPGSGFADGLVIQYARVSAANTVEIKLANFTGSAINPPSMDFQISIIN